MWKKANFYTVDHDGDTRSVIAVANLPDLLFSFYSILVRKGDEWWDVPGAVGVGNAVIQHGQFDLGFQVDVARAEAACRDGLGVQVAERLCHLASDTHAIAQRHLLGRQVKPFVQRTPFQFAAKNNNNSAVAIQGTEM